MKDENLMYLSNDMLQLVRADEVRGVDDVLRYRRSSSSQPVRYLSLLTARESTYDRRAVPLGDKKIALSLW